MINLIFTDKQCNRLNAHLFPGDGLEALAFCLATQVKYPGGSRFLINEVWEIPHEQCDRSEDNLTWSTADIAEVLDKAADKGMSVIKIHSHPRGPRAFSEQDDRSDFGFFPSIYNWCEGNAQHCSVIFTEDFIVGRMIDKNNQEKMIDNVWVAGHPLRLYPYRPGSTIVGFDESTYDVFHGIKIGIVGCSGTGGWVVELSGRNEVGSLVACDPDILGKKNLNRVINSKMNLCGKNKAALAADVIREMGTGTFVEVSESSLHSVESIELLKSCDVIFGCVDSVFARHVLNTLCSYYMIPLFDIGVYIESTGKSISAAVSGFEYIVPGGSSLRTRGIFSPDDLAAETYHLKSPNHFKRLKDDGYIRGQVVGRPAVAATNCKAASMCFEEFQARVLGYRSDVDEPLASKVFCAKSGEYFVKQETDFEVDTILLKKVGWGDQFFKNEAHLLFAESYVPEAAV